MRRVRTWVTALFLATCILGLAGCDNDSEPGATYSYHHSDVGEMQLDNRHRAPQNNQTGRRSVPAPAPVFAEAKKAQHSHSVGEIEVDFR